MFLAEDGAEEIVGASVDGVLAKLVTRGDGIVLTIQLLVEALFDAVEESLLGGRERGVVLPSIDELLCHVGNIAECLHVIFLGKHDRGGFVIAFVGRVGFRLADLGDVSHEVMKHLLALNDAGVSTKNLFNVTFVIDFCHIDVV